MDAVKKHKRDSPCKQTIIEKLVVEKLGGFTIMVTGQQCFPTSTGYSTLDAHLCCKFSAIFLLCVLFFSLISLSLILQLFFHVCLCDILTIIVVIRMKDFSNKYSSIVRNSPVTINKSLKSSAEA